MNLKAELFTERIINFCKKLLIFSKNINSRPIHIRVISQLVASATSVGANYTEANNAESKKDFLHKIRICKKEAAETEYWLNLIGVLYPSKKTELNELRNEMHELLLIFSKIAGKTKK